MSDTEAPPHVEEKSTGFDFGKYKAEEKSHGVAFKSKKGEINIKCNPNHRRRKSPYSKTQLKKMIGDEHKTDPHIVKQVHRFMRRGHDYDTSLAKYRKQGYKSRSRNVTSPQ